VQKGRKFVTFATHVRTMWYEEKVSNFEIAVPREDRNLPPCMIYLVLQYLRGILQEFDFSAEKWQYQLYYLLFIIVVVDVEKGYGGCSDTSVWVVNGRTSVEKLAWIRYWREYVIGVNT
jgi:hypothetical protein